MSAKLLSALEASLFRLGTVSGLRLPAGGLQLQAEEHADGLRDATSAGLSRTHGSSEDLEFLTHVYHTFEKKYIYIFNDVLPARPKWAEILPGGSWRLSRRSTAWKIAMSCKRLFKRMHRLGTGEGVWFRN